MTATASDDLYNPKVATFGPVSQASVGAPGRSCFKSHISSFITEPPFVLVGHHYPAFGIRPRRRIITRVALHANSGENLAGREHLPGLPPLPYVRWDETVA